MTTTMAQVAISEPGGPEVLQLRRTAVPSPSPGEILVRVSAAGVNRPDVMQRRGEYPMPPGVNPIPGLEVAGEVVSVGSDVTYFRVGERVCGLTEGGGYAEYCVVPASQALHTPDGVTDIQAAAIPETFFTVWANVFDMGGARPGDRLLVHGGTSGIGSTALMLGSELGLRTMATDGGREKCDAALRLGAERVVDYRVEDFVQAVADWTEGAGVDLILDIVGGDYLSRNVEALGKRGRLLTIGYLGGEVGDGLNLLQLALKRAVITGSTMRSRTAAEKASIARELEDKIWPAMAASRCHPLVHAEFPLTEAGQAHRLMESGQHIGKIVLRVAD